MCLCHRGASLQSTSDEGYVPEVKKIKEVSRLESKLVNKNKGGSIADLTFLDSDWTTCAEAVHKEGVAQKQTISFATAFLDFFVLVDWWPQRLALCIINAIDLHDGSALFD